MDNEYLAMELTVADVNRLIEEIEMLRHGLNVNNLNEKEREDIRYHLAIYINMLRNKKVVV